MKASDRFKLNAMVTVKREPAEPHCRTPFYLRGKTGTLVADLGCFRDPSRLAFHKPGLPTLRLFRVKFSQHSLWPEYGPSNDTLFADIYESWLEPSASDDDSRRKDASSHA